jgi:hypothetical protein
MLPDPAVHPGNLSLEETGLPASLEQRVQRLEQVMAGMQDTQGLEDRIAERVQERLQNSVPVSMSVESVAAGEPPIPQVKAPPQEGVFVSSTPAADPVRSSWLLWDFFSEARAMVRMFFDWRYRVAVSTWVIVVLMVPLILFSDWWFPPAYLPFVGKYFDKVLDIFLTFIAYMVLSREARRYIKFRGK